MEKKSEDAPLLVAQFGPLNGQRWSIRNKMVIGRGSMCDIMIADRQISRQHALLTSTSNGVLLEDLNSKNGTLLNGEPLEEAVLLDDGDLLQIAFVQQFLYLSSDATLPLDADSQAPPSALSGLLRLDKRSRRVWIGDQEVLPPQLDQLVEQAGSYLNIWREYNKLERESVLRRARSLGWLRYSKRQLQGDGRWRFFVEDVKQLETALEVLRNAEDIDLEAAQNPPPELQQATDEFATTLEEAPTRSQRSRVFVGAFSGGELQRRTVDLQPPIDSDDREPPDSGVLFLSVSGDRKRLKRREQAQSLIASSECPMPQLGLLLEGSAVPERRRKTEDALSVAARAAFGGEPTARQIEAMRVALNTPDIALIQGPPGTGKTKTLAALEVRLAELSEDDLAGQTLLTSYQHDAVENAASRTLVFGLPAIKVGRKRGTTDQSDGFDRWRRERADAVRADLATLPERPVTEVLRKVRTLAAAYVASPLTPDESLRVVRDVQELCRSYVPPSLNDRLEVLLGKQRRWRHLGES